ncbi:MAG: DUF1667 domain-containing protein [Promethearchaeota archaeon]
MNTNAKFKEESEDIKKDGTIEKDIVCVICPNSCRLKVTQDIETKEINVEGNLCPRGKKYGISEFSNPVRMLITTMRIENGKLPVIPVRSVEAIPKHLLLDAIKIVNDTYCTAPIKMGDVLIENILNTKIPVIASRDMEKKN